LRAYDVSNQLAGSDTNCERGVVAPEYQNEATTPRLERLDKVERSLGIVSRLAQALVTTIRVFLPIG
jgi:hypothetical protein